MKLVNLTSTNETEITLLLRIEGEFFRVAAVAQDGKLIARIDESNDWTAIAQCEVPLKEPADA